MRGQGKCSLAERQLHRGTSRGMAKLGSLLEALWREGRRELEIMQNQTGGDLFRGRGKGLFLPGI